ncbi:hypothetical protein FHL15_002714 [Xylaria flabelliformis]|uniref:Xylanolytic transcriptional activator regulatory domain-containing protein n=1 Tax=Xylaria flabelliformis TaxID=2512241 RepID=A0A553I8D5_9PEZI|nr:hypothetical protein FHL15_002714 [Xylaria flabelliformis]
MSHDERKDADDASRWSPTEFETADSKSISNRSKAGIRVSLACVQCRSKQRGIRDPKKRSLISDLPPISSPQRISTTIKCAPVVPFSVSKHLSNGWTASKPTGTNTNESLVSAFFDHFYLGHPILPPKRFFLKYVESDPNPYHFLLSVIDFCGALYVGHTRLNDLREAAYSAACGPLPFTVQSVQGLHLLAIIAFGESRYSHYTGFGNRSREMAIELGIHRRSFAARISDSVWAESCRRTWWCIRFQSTLRQLNEAEFTVDAYDVESDTDIPCAEEWEYQSGDIPLPMSLLQYEREINLGRSDFSSLAFQIEICRIQIEVARLCSEDGDEDEKRSEYINQADSRICDFLRRIPQWKMDVVDPDGKPDQVLFGAVAWAHISRIRLRQSNFRNGLNIREYFPLGPNCGPNHKGQDVKRFGWNPHSIDIQAANSMVPGLLRVAIVYLDACVFLGLDSPIFRERINALIRILKIHGETWPLSRKIAEDIQAVADEYLGPKDQSSAHSDGWSTVFTEPMSSAPFFESSTVGFDPCSFLDSQMQAVPIHYHQSDHVVPPIVSTFLPQGLTPAISGL